jgi:outer membrane lipoprotein-sorting protein
MRAHQLLFVWIVTAAPFGPRFAMYAADDSLEAVFARMDKASAKFKDLTADMKRVSYTAFIQEETVDTGTIAVKLPKPHDYHLLMDFKTPDPKQVMLAGTKVVIYYPKTNTAQEIDLGKSNKGQIESFMRLGFGSNSRDLENAYSVKYGGPETVEGQKATRIELIPKSKDVAVQFPKFELWISDETGISIQQKIYQPGGDYSLATYTNMKINQNLPDSAVKLTLPPHVRIEHLQK